MYVCTYVLMYVYTHTIGYSEGYVGLTQNKLLHENFQMFLNEIKFMCTPLPKHKTF